MALAALGFAVAACVAYAAQRLIDAQTEAPLAVVLRRADIPYYWRVGLSLVQALGVGALLWVALNEDQAQRWLARMPWLLPLMVLPAALAMAATP